MRTTIALILILAASPAYAQIEECPFFRRQIDALVAGQAAAAVNILDPGQGARCYAVYVAGGDGFSRLSFSDFVKRFESSRSDKQSGAGTTASGATSVVAQGPAAKVLSVAAEYGAVTQDVNGQVITLRGNLAGLPSALVKHEIFPYCVGSEMSNAYCVNGSLLSLLRRVSISASFDATRGTQATVTPAPAGGTSATPQPVVFTASKNEVSAVSARVELWNHRDTTSQDFLAAWKKKVPDAMTQTSTDLLQAAGTFYEDVKSAPGFAAWNTKHLGLIRAAGTDRKQIVMALKTALGEFLTLARTVPMFQEHADAALASYSKFFLAQDELLDSLNTTVVAFEYANNRPAGQPPTSHLGLIADIPLAAQTKAVLNAGVTFYDDQAAVAAIGASRLRDAQAAVELEQSLGTSALTGPLVFSIAASLPVSECTVHPERGSAQSRSRHQLRRTAGRHHNCLFDDRTHHSWSGEADADAARQQHQDPRCRHIFQPHGVDRQADVASAGRRHLRLRQPLCRSEIA